MIKELRKKNQISDMSACGQSVPFELFQCVVSQNSAGPNGKLRSPRADMVLRFINPSGRFNNLSGQFINPSAQIIKSSGQINKLSGQIILNRSDDLLIRPDRLVVAGCLLTGYLC